MDYSQFSALPIDYDSPIEFDSGFPIYTKEQVVAGVVDLESLPCASVDSGIASRIHSTDPRLSTSAAPLTPEIPLSIEELEKDLLLGDNTTASPSFSEVFRRIQDHFLKPEMGTPNLLVSTMPSGLASSTVDHTKDDPPVVAPIDDVEMYTDDDLQESDVAQIWSTLGPVAEPALPTPFEASGLDSDDSSDTSEDDHYFCCADGPSESSTELSHMDVDRCKTVDRIARLMCFIKTIISHAGISGTLFYPRLREAITPLMRTDLTQLGAQYRPKLLPYDHPDHRWSSLFSTDRRLSNGEMRKLCQFAQHDICHLQHMASHGGIDGFLFNPFNSADQYDVQVKRFPLLLTVKCQVLVTFPLSLSRIFLICFKWILLTHREKNMTSPLMTLTLIRSNVLDPSVLGPGRQGIVTRL